MFKKKMAQKTSPLTPKKFPWYYQLISISVVLSTYVLAATVLCGAFGFYTLKSKCQSFATNTSQLNDDIVWIEIVLWVLIIVMSCLMFLLSFLFIQMPVNKIAKKLVFLTFMDVDPREEEKLPFFLEMKILTSNMNTCAKNVKQYNNIYNSRNGVVLLNSKLNVIFFNHPFKLNFDVYDLEEAGAWINKLFENDQELVIELQNIVTTHYYNSMIKEIQIEEGGTTVFYKITARISDHNNRMVIMGVEDITDQLRNEVDLLQSRQEADKANQAKTEFLSHVTHELRTPLNGVIGMSSLLVESGLSSDQISLVESIKFSADLLLSLINDILDLTKIEAGAVELVHVPFDLLDLAENIIFSTSQAHVQKQETEILAWIDPRLPAKIIGDHRRLSQILNNLLSNACKFTDRGHVFMKFTLTGFENNKVQFHVECADTGVGVKEKDQGNLLKEFYQANPNGPKGGTGLGLSITHALIEMMDGKGLDFTSDWGNGSTFYFDLSLPFEGHELIQDKMPACFKNKPPRNHSLPETSLDVPNSLKNMRRHSHANIQNNHSTLSVGGAGGSNAYSGSIDHYPVNHKTRTSTSKQVLIIAASQALRELLIRYLPSPSWSYDTKTTQQALEEVLSREEMYINHLKNPLMNFFFEEQGQYNCIIVDNNSLAQGLGSSEREIRKRLISQIFIAYQTRMEMAPTSPHLVWIVYVSPRMFTTINTPMFWFGDHYNKLSVITKPPKYVQLSECLAFVFDPHYTPMNDFPAMSDDPNDESNMVIHENSIMTSQGKRRSSIQEDKESAVIEQVEQITKAKSNVKKKTKKKKAKIDYNFPPGLRVLLVEDNAINIQVATSMLKKAKIYCEVAHDGREAIEKVKEADQISKGYHIILMDIQMPIMGGLQASRLIRKYEELEKIYRHIIIAMTADVVATSFDVCSQMGMDDYFPKPICLEGLLKIISIWCDKLATKHPELHVKPEGFDDNDGGGEKKKGKGRRKKKSQIKEDFEADDVASSSSTGQEKGTSRTKDKPSKTAGDTTTSTIEVGENDVATHDNLDSKEDEALLENPNSISNGSSSDRIKSKRSKDKNKIEKELLDTLKDEESYALTNGFGDGGVEEDNGPQEDAFETKIDMSTKNSFMHDNGDDINDNSKNTITRNSKGDVHLNNDNDDAHDHDTEDNDSSLNNDGNMLHNNGDIIEETTIEMNVL